MKNGWLVLWRCTWRKMSQVGEGKVFERSVRLWRRSAGWKRELGLSSTNPHCHDALKEGKARPSQMQNEASLPTRKQRQS